MIGTIKCSISLGRLDANTAVMNLESLELILEKVTFIDAREFFAFSQIQMDYNQD